MNRPRLKHCTEQWPECTDGEYNPSCCRFPKSCSCTIYNDDTPPDELEDATADAPAQPCLDLEERIARLIDPTAWIKADTCREVGWPDERYERKSRTAAQRVIDGLHLDIISSHHSFDGHRHRYDLTGHLKEDA